MTISSRWLLTVALLTILLNALRPANVAATVIIDDFSVGPITLTRTTPFTVTHTQSGLDPAHVVGGRRDFTITASQPTQTLTIDSAVGELQVNGYIDGVFTITYGQGGPLNLNAAGPGKAIMVDIPGINNGTLRYGSPTVYLHSAGGNVNANAWTVSGVIERPIPGGARFLMPVSSFFTEGTPDLSAIRRVEVIYNDPGLLQRLSLVALVPEPGGLGLCVTGLIALLPCVRRLRLT